MAAATGAAGAALSAVAPPLGGGLVLLSMGMFGAAKKMREEEAAVGAPEILGEVTVTHEGGQWTLGSDLTPPLFALTLPHYLERVLHNCDPEIAASFVAGLRARLDQLVPDNNAREFFASGGRRVLFNGMREWGAPTWKFSARAQLGRKPDSSRFLNERLYFALTEFTPAQILQQDLAHSLVPLYERALTLPPEIAMLTLQILRLQVLLYVQHGPPTNEMLGAVPNVATLLVFEELASGNRAHADVAFARYVTGQFDPNA